MSTRELQAMADRPADESSLLEAGKDRVTVTNPDPLCFVLDRAQQLAGPSQDGLAIGR